MMCPECESEMEKISILSPYWPGYECKVCDEMHLIPLSEQLENNMKRKMGLPEDYAI